MRIGIVFSIERKPKAYLPSLEIAQWLEEKGHKVFINPDESVFEIGLNFVIAAGGDGTVLHIADKIAKYEIPLIGVNFGHRGFLCDIREDEIHKKLGSILEGNFDIIQRTRVQVKVFNDGQMTREIDALNEVLIGGINRTVFLKVETIDKTKSFESTIIGDGIMIATETGSTAYNLNAGGPVLITDVFSAVANNAHFDSDFLFANTKSFVTSTDAIFKIAILNEFEENLPFLVADGQRDYRFKKGDFAEVRKSANRTLFIKV
ncbi:MAG: NAD(+)/NADH kinase [Patescibacteria group bacterium]|nr:NAD(+)/NADH kinase [Patescibacteria group bacterium]